MSDIEHTDEQGEFLRQNADFFVQAYAGLMGIYGSGTKLNIVSEEKAMTLAVGLIETDEPGVMDVNCVQLTPEQASLKNCIDSIWN